MSERISIVIIGRNEESRISKCVEAAIAAAEQLGGAEILYIDSASTDRTVSIVESFGVKTVPLDLRLKRSPSAGRHMGTFAANGEFIVFLDADTILYRDFISEALTIFESDPKIAGVNGFIDDLDEEGQILDGIEERPTSITDVKWLRGPCCFYRRSALVSTGSFSPHLASEEEAELGLRLIRMGWKLKSIPIKMACHTRCYHGRTLANLVETFVRDIKSRRLGEVTKTAAVAFREGNGLAFCWLRLHTSIIFSIWLLAVAIAFLLPHSLYPVPVAVVLIALGLAAVWVKKRSIYQTFLFIPLKVLNIIDLVAGIPKVFASPIDRKVGSQQKQLARSTPRNLDKFHVLD